MLAITTYEEWFSKRVGTDVRRNVKKAAKLGVIARSTPFDDALVQGIVDIYNESRFRQGRPFWHYGKDFETVKAETGHCLEKSEFIGAYCGGEMIGFIKLLLVDLTNHIVLFVSKQSHFDKKATNALLAKAVEVCAQKGVPYLTYGKLAHGNRANSSLAEFKRRHGLEQINFPHYQVPLTLTGRLAVKFKLYRSLNQILPERALSFLVDIRAKYYDMRGAAWNHKAQQNKARKEAYVRMFTKATISSGRPVSIECLEIAGQTFAIDRGLVTVVGLEDEWYEDVRDPAAAVEILKEAKSVRPDLFTFWQRIPDVEPRFSYHREWEDIAVLPVTTYDDWWKSRIKSRVRNQIRKAEKDGLIVKEVPYDDDFVRGMTAIFNESPIRQGRPFWHYGKDFETVSASFHDSSSASG